MLKITVKWSDELAEELHTIEKMKFKKRKAVVYRIHQTCASDAVEMQPWTKCNLGYKSMLTFIDEFSKYGWRVPLKDNTEETVAHAVREVIKVLET